MSYSLNQCITNAFYLSKVRSKDFQQIDGDDITVGLDLFNKVLAGMDSNQKMIPYYSEYEFPAIIGQEKYFIPKLVLPLTLTFNMQVVRFGTTNIGRKKYHGKTRVEGLIALPFEHTFERCLGGSNLFVQLLPCEPFLFKVWGRFGLENVTVADLTSDLLLTFDLWYIDYLEMLTAKRICAYYGVEVNQSVQFFLDEISANVNDQNYIDLEPEKTNLYSTELYPNWVQIQLSRGFTPG